MVAQLVSAPDLGSGGRRFESGSPYNNPPNRLPWKDEVIEELRAARDVRYRIYYKKPGLIPDGWVQMLHALVGKLVDPLVLSSSALCVWVRVPPGAHGIWPIHLMVRIRDFRSRHGGSILPSATTFIALSSNRSGNKILTLEIGVRVPVGRLI